MAEPDSHDPVLRESTRITCAGAFATQSTYDIFQWENTRHSHAGHPGQRRAVAVAFGMPEHHGADLSEQTEIRKKLDLLSMMDKNDPPVFVFNKHKNGIPSNDDERNHHPLHARAIREKAAEVGLRAIVYAPEIGIVDSSGKDLVAFFLEEFFKK